VGPTNYEMELSNSFTYVEHHDSNLGHEVLAVMKMDVMVFWVVTPCNDMVGHHRF